MTDLNPDKERVASVMADFQDKVLAHPILKSVRSELLENIHAPSGRPIIALVGPTGIGKTTLSNNIEREILIDNEQQMRADPGYVPIIRVEAPAPEMGRFAWADFYTRTLEKFNEPLIDRKGTDVFVPRGHLINS